MENLVLLRFTQTLIYMRFGSAYYSTAHIMFALNGFVLLVGLILISSENF